MKTNRINKRTRTRQRGSSVVPLKVGRESDEDTQSKAFILPSRPRPTSKSSQTKIQTGSSTIAAETGGQTPPASLAWTPKVKSEQGHNQQEEKKPLSSKKQNKKKDKNNDEQWNDKVEQEEFMYADGKLADVRPTDQILENIASELQELRWD